MIIEKDGTISYAEIEKSPREVSVSTTIFPTRAALTLQQVSGAEAVLARL